MLQRQLLRLAACLALVGVLGCTPSENRESTEVKKSSEVEISAGEVAKEEPAEVAPAAAPSGTAQPAEPVAAAAPAAESQPSATPAATPASPAAPAAATPATTATTDGPAKFVGRVVVNGEVAALAPLLKQGQETKDQVCSDDAVPNEKYVVSSDGGLANVFVYMKRAPKSGVPEPSGDPVDLDQKGCLFIPHASIFRVGQPLHLKNSDPVAHNVRISTFVNTPFNQTIPANDATGLDFLANRAERTPSEIRCDIHAWMGAWALALDHPWGAVTDADGRFDINDLPDGTWEFVVWHEAAGYVDRGFEVNAVAGQVVEQEFTVDPAKLVP